MPGRSAQRRRPIKTGMQFTWPRTIGGCRARRFFGTVLVAIPWREEVDAIRMANDSHYGFAAYVWAHDIGSGLRAAHAIESGWVQVNQGLGQQPGHSYGGYKESGIGREFSLEGMLDSFTQRKNVTMNLNTPRWL
jgi:betaine-aldehyde dehydrogenase